MFYRAFNGPSVNEGWRHCDGWGRTLRPESDSWCREFVPEFTREAWPQLPPPANGGYPRDRLIPPPPPPARRGPLPNPTRPMVDHPIRRISLQDLMELKLDSVPFHIKAAARRCFPPRFQSNRFPLPPRNQSNRVPLPPRNQSNRVPLPPRNQSNRIPVPVDPMGPTVDRVKDLARNMAKWVQVQHHLKNWNPIPASILKKISLITENLRPPLADSLLNGKYQEVGRQFGLRISEVTKAHLESHACKIQEALKSFDPAHLPSALPLSKKLFNDKQEYNMSWRFNNLMDECARLVGLSFQTSPPVPAPSTTLPKYCL